MRGLSIVFIVMFLIVVSVPVRAQKILPSDFWGIDEAYVKDIKNLPSDNITWRFRTARYLGAKHQRTRIYFHQLWPSGIENDYDNEVKEKYDFIFSEAQNHGINVTVLVHEFPGWMTGLDTFNPNNIETWWCVPERDDPRYAQFLQKWYESWKKLVKTFPSVREWEITNEPDLSLHPSSYCNRFITAFWGGEGDVPLAGDYDGDGVDDMVVWRPSEGNWYIKSSKSGNMINFHMGKEGDIPLTGDYDGDGVTDLVVWDSSEGIFNISKSSDGQYIVKHWGEEGDIPLSGDYDGDGITDIVVWRPANGKFYVLSSSSGFVTTVVYFWGERGDIPLSGDYDGDGVTDLAVWRPYNGKFYIKYSSDNSFLEKFFGNEGDTPVVADYDGDGRDDIIVWRPLNNYQISYWYISQSSDDFNTNALVKELFWRGGHIPITGDYDGDGIDDLGVWNHTNGRFSILSSSRRRDFTLEQKAAITVDLLYYASKAIKETDPGDLRIMGAIAGLFCSPTDKFLGMIYGYIKNANDGVSDSSTNSDDYFQVVAWHPYNQLYDCKKDNIETFDNEWLQKNIEIHSIMEKYGDGGKDVFWTEFGINSDDEDCVKRGFTRMVKLLRDHLPWVKRMYWYVFVDNPTWGGPNSGFLRRDFTLKPVAYTYRKLQGDLNNDGKTDIMDLTLLASEFGKENPVTDVIQDGEVDIYDIIFVASRFT